MIAEPMTKRARILMAAEEILSERGGDATISEISSTAGVFDSEIYQYFRSKEDLLFSLAAERIREAIQDLGQQLQGIREPVSKLGKFVWWQLHRHDTNRRFSDIVLFQCRSRPAFYLHSAFARIQEVRRILVEIVQEGVAKGVFRGDVKIQAFRDMGFGLMDLECIMSLAARETDTARQDLEPVMDLLLHALSPGGGRKVRVPDKSARLLQAAERIFAEKGYEHATIRDIASRAGVADGTVYQYFRNKDDLLYRTIAAGFGPSAAKEGFQPHLEDQMGVEKPRSGLGRLRRFMRNFFSIYLNQPWFARVLVLHGIYNRAFYHSGAYSVLMDYMGALGPMLEQGAAEGSIRPGVEPRLVRNLILGSFSHLVLRWVFSEDESRFDRLKEIQDMVDLMISCLVSEDEKAE